MRYFVYFILGKTSNRLRQTVIPLEELKRGTLGRLCKFSEATVVSRPGFPGPEVPSATSSIS